jgi:hypothetical protein
MKREVIFEIPETNEYRIICRYGYSEFIDFAWWAHIQKKTYYKKFIFFGEMKWFWVEIDRCWWNEEIESMDILKNKSYKFFDEIVFLKQKLDKKAMEL